MPVVTIVSNAVASVEEKQAFTSGLGQAFQDLLRTPKEHVHVVIDDGKFLSFGGDHTTPAAYIKVEASSRQIMEDSRKQLVDRLVPLLKALFGCDGYRTTTFFVEHPVENIAVGDQIIQFSSPKSPAAGGLKVMF